MVYLKNFFERVVVMYNTVENGLRMTMHEASEHYPDSYVLMQRDSVDFYEPAGIILYVGDNFDELFELQVDLPVPLGLVVEGLNHQRSLGGIVIQQERAIYSRYGQYLTYD
jgi:hypothetical protein